MSVFYLLFVCVLGGGKEKRELGEAYDIFTIPSKLSKIQMNPTNNLLYLSVSFNVCY